MLVAFALILIAVCLPETGSTEEEPAFPDIFQLLLGRNGLRFQYELNTIVDNKGELVAIIERRILIKPSLITVKMQVALFSPLDPRR